MSETQPTGEQIRFRSANTGDHILDTYLESAEIGGRTLTDLLDDLFDPSNNGVFRSDNFEFRFDSNKIQFRVGQFASSTAGFTDVTTFFAIKGTFSTSTAYNNFDVVTTSDKDVYIVHGLSTATTYSSESNFISSANTTKIVDVSEAKDWAIKTDGIVSSTGYSSKAWAVGGIGIGGAANRGSAKEWATKTDGSADNADFSAKAWAIGGTGVDNTSSRGAAKDWATKTGGTVDGSDFSAKHYATTGNVANVAGALTAINNVNGALTAIGDVNSNETNINKVAAVDNNVSTVATNISTVNSLAATLAGTQTFAVTVAGGVFVIDGANNPALTLIRGFTYTFDVSDSSNGAGGGHPLQFKNGSSAYTTGVTVSGTAGQAGATVVFAVPDNAPASGLLYYCTNHGNSMGNSITTQDDNIAIVASLSSDINTVANNDGNITTVANANTNINNLNASGVIGNIATVATISTEVGQVAAVATEVGNASANATKAQNYAVLIDSPVETSPNTYSAKAWAVGGGGVTDTAGSGSAKEWATDTSNTCDGTEYSAKEYAIGTQNAQSNGSAKQWAIGGGTGFTTSTAVAGGLYSAKYYAEAAETASASASGSLSSFQAVYLGSGSSNPSSGHTAGDLFFNTSDNKLKYFNGSAWVSIEPSTGVTQGQALAFAIAL